MQNTDLRLFIENVSQTQLSCTKNIRIRNNPDSEIEVEVEIVLVIVIEI